MKEGAGHYNRKARGGYKCPVAFQATYHRAYLSIQAANLGPPWPLLLGAVVGQWDLGGALTFPAIPGVHEMQGGGFGGAASARSREAEGGLWTPDGAKRLSDCLCRLGVPLEMVTQGERR